MVKNILKTFKSNRYFLLFIFLFSYAYSIQVRYFVRHQINWYLFTPEAAIVDFLSACLLFFVMKKLFDQWFKEQSFTLVRLLQIFALSATVYVLIINAFSLILALSFNTFERNFNQTTFISDNLQHALTVMIYGGFFCAYYFYKRDNKTQRNLAAQQKIFLEGRILHLKNQLNPHFLFNNLNTLDHLIDEDPVQASDFLHEFSEIYRYVMDASEKKLVPLTAEIQFSERYAKMMQFKYGEAYTLTIHKPELVEGYVVPLALQLLIENAYQHNVGTLQTPVNILVTIGETISVINNLTNTSSKSKGSSGIGLKNLTEQYRLIFNKTVVVEKKQDSFSVSLPIILQMPND